MLIIVAIHMPGGMLLIQLAGKSIMSMFDDDRPHSLIPFFRFDFTRWFVSAAIGNYILHEILGMAYVKFIMEKSLIWKKK